MGEGVVFPPPVVFFDGADYWLASGFHRRAAHEAVAEALGLANPEIDCDVRQGTVRDAVLFSVGENATHGMRRTNDDKRRAVLTLLNDPEWAEWSDREIARRCAVDHDMVGRLRPRVVTGGNRQSKQRTYTTRHGTTATMNVAGINAGRPAADNPAGPTPRQTDIEDAVPKPPPPTLVTDFDWLFPPLRALDNAIRALPSPDETVANFPVTLSGVMTLERALEISRWCQDFARLWAARQPEFASYRTHIEERMSRVAS
jgi:hypothetical protein